MACSTILLTIRQLGADLAAPLLGGQAYLDPGTGSYVLQLAIAALVGFAFLIKAYWARLRSFFRKLFTRESKETRGEP